MTVQEQSSRRRSIRWSAVRLHIAFFSVGALLTYAMFSSGAVLLDPNESFGPTSPRATILGRISAEDSQLVLNRDVAPGMIQIDRADYCKQVATAVLVRFNHRISESEIVFERDPRLPGNAIQQFADAFGYAIETGLGSDAPSESKRGSKK